MVMWGATAAVSNSTLSIFNLCCDGTLNFPPLSPAVLKPDLGHRIRIADHRDGERVTDGNKENEKGQRKVKQRPDNLFLF